MDRNDLMKMSAAKALAELSWESIEFLFKPTTFLEMFLRTNFEGTVEKYQHFPTAREAIEVERFYRLLKYYKELKL